MKNIYITESQFNELFPDKKDVLYEHVNILNGVKLAEDIIREEWTSPDDFWFIQITQRKKDFRNYNARHGGTSKWWNRVPSIDGSSRENFAGYGIVQGNTVDEAVNSLKNVTVKLNDWAAKIIGTPTVPSNGAIEGVISVCDKLWARAYMTINKRSMSLIQGLVKKDVARGRGLRSFEKHSSEPYTGYGSEKTHPMTLIDNDIDDQKAWDDMEKLVKSKGYTPFRSTLSHDGKHFLYKTPDIEKIDFSQFNRYSTNNKPGDPPVLVKRDAKIILYSPCGQ